jgi:DNA-binding transcriptional ArsR family regulator
MSDMPTVLSRSEKIPHPPASSLDLATIMRTLGDPIRLEILRLVDGHDGEMTCSEITTQLALQTSTGSYHMRLLREAGLTRTRAEGTQRLISVRRADLDERFPGLIDVLTR